jgi:hypothetical protein
MEPDASMAKPESPVEIRIAESATPEVLEAFGRLLLQLSSSAAPLTREALAEIIASPHNTMLLARDTHAAGRMATQRGAKTVDLTSHQSRQAAHRLY